MIKDYRPDESKKEDPKFILIEEKGKNTDRKYILSHLWVGRGIEILAKSGGILFEDCAILLKIATTDEDESDYPQAEFFIIPPGHVMYENYVDADVTEIEYFFDPYEVFLEDMKRVMIEKRWEFSEILDMLEKIKKQMELSEVLCNSAE